VIMGLFSRTLDAWDDVGYAWLVPLFSTALFVLGKRSRFLVRWVQNSVGRPV
jgi:hypothetical protein